MKIPLAKAIRLAVVQFSDGSAGIVLTPEENRAQSFVIGVELLGGGTTSRERDEEVEVLATPYSLAKDFLQTFEKSNQKGGEINYGKRNENLGHDHSASS